MPDTVFSDPRLAELYDVRRAGFHTPSVRDAPDRPGPVFVVVTQPDRERSSDVAAAPHRAVGS